MWQDIVIATGGALFVIALIPSVLSKNKPAILTSLLTGTVLLAFAITYTTLGLWLAFSTTILTAVLWFTLLFQVMLKGREQ